LIIQLQPIISKLFCTENTLNLDSLIFQLLPISDYYQLFGYAAGIPADKLDKIVSTSKSSFHGLTEVCSLWLKECHNKKCPPSWQQVAEILSEMGEQKLAENILQLHFSGKS